MIAKCNWNFAKKIAYILSVLCPRMCGIAVYDCVRDSRCLFWWLQTEVRHITLPRWRHYRWQNFAAKHQECGLPQPQTLHTTQAENHIKAAKVNRVKRQQENVANAATVFTWLVTWLTGRDDFDKNSKDKQQTIRFDWNIDMNWRMFIEESYTPIKLQKLMCENTAQERAATTRVDDRIPSIIHTKVKSLKICWAS